ncbi:MAG: GTPase, partial [Candidatus Helarchaeales archaeon]
GRSNVGKSSIFRLLTNQKKGIAVGKKAGTTQSIRRQEMRDYILVDMPGLRFKQARSMQKKIISYVERNAHPNFRIIQTAVLILDIKLFPELVKRWKERQIPLDIELFKFLQEFDLNPIVACNKSDKLPMKDLESALNLVAQELELAKCWKDVPDVIIPCSAKTRKGIADLRKAILKRFN